MRAGTAHLPPHREEDQRQRAERGIESARVRETTGPRIQPVIEQYHDTSDDTVLLAEHGGSGERARRYPMVAAGGENGAEQGDGDQQIGAAHEPRYGFHVHRMDREHEACREDAWLRDPARQHHHHQEGREAVPHGVH